MTIREPIAAMAAEMTAWRRDIHAHPETAFQEVRTADFVAMKLEEFAIDVHRGFAKTGVVGTLKNGDGPAIGLRADMDALFIDEQNTFDHVSRHDGIMHACGHDGHTTMLLGAAKYLAETRNFKGTVHFIFQPAEETEGGGQVMVEEGLFEDFPVDAVYGMHNWPGIPVGFFAIRPGPLMAASDTFEITIEGQGAHGAMPHLGKDPVVAGAAMVQALQTLSSREADPLDSVVVSVTCFNAGDTWNVIPETAVLRGTARSFRPESRDLLEHGIKRIAEGIANAHGVSVTADFQRRYPPLVNHGAETQKALAAARAVAGADNVIEAVEPSMGGEDFAFMLEARPGAYIWIGNGPGQGGCMLHSPTYDFNDEILGLGASYWATLVERELRG